MGATLRTGVFVRNLKLENYLELWLWRDSNHLGGEWLGCGFRSSPGHLAVNVQNAFYRAFPRIASRLLVTALLQALTQRVINQNPV